jgi:hypothetical protein
VRSEFFHPSVLAHAARIGVAEAESVPVILSFERPQHSADFFASAHHPEALKERYKLAISQAVNDAWLAAAATAKPPKEHRSINAVSITLPLSVLKALSDKGEQVGLRRGGIELDYPIKTALNQVRPKVGVDFVRSTFGGTGRGVRVAVLDTGIARNHIDLQNRILDSTDFTGEGPGDQNGHGTHVAGIVGGTGQGEGGKYSGVAPEADLLDVKVLGHDGGGRASNLLSGIEWAVARQAKVLNLSIQGPVSDGSDAISRSVNWAVQQGVVACVAAGNQGPDPGTVTAPGAASEAITVGALDHEDRVADFSSRGGAGPGQADKPDLVLPGFVVSCRTPGLPFEDLVGDLYRLEKGTSQASPIAAGFCALLLQANPTLAPAGMKSRLKQTSVDLHFPSSDQGAGRGDIRRAFEGVGPVSAPPPQRDVVLGAVVSELGLTANSIGRVRIELTNRSAGPLSNVRALLSTEAGNVFVLFPTGDYGALQPGETDSAAYLVEYGDVTDTAVGIKLAVHYSASNGPHEAVLQGSLPVRPPAGAPPGSTSGETLASLLGKTHPEVQSDRVRSFLANPGLDSWGRSVKGSSTYLVGKGGRSFLLISALNASSFRESEGLGLRLGRDEAAQIARRHILTKFESRGWPELDAIEPDVFGEAPSWVVYLSFPYKDNFHCWAKVSVDGRDGHVLDTVFLHVSNLPRIVVVD